MIIDDENLNDKNKRNLKMKMKNEDENEMKICRSEMVVEMDVGVEEAIRKKVRIK